MILRVHGRHPEPNREVKGKGYFGIARRARRKVQEKPENERKTHNIIQDS
jgi:hypothetical protein